MLAPYVYMIAFNVIGRICQVT